MNQGEWAVVSDEGRVQSRFTTYRAAEGEAWLEFCHVEHRPEEAFEPTDAEVSAVDRECAAALLAWS